MPETIATLALCNTLLYRVSMYHLGTPLAMLWFDLLLNNQFILSLYSYIYRCVYLEL